MSHRVWAWVPKWALWRLQRDLLTYVLVINVMALVATVATAQMVSVDLQDLVRFGVLAICAWLAIELTRHIERKRAYWRRPTSGYMDTKSIWSFAAVIILPPALASAMVILTYVVAWMRIKPEARPDLVHRWVFSCATVLCGTQAAVAVLAAGAPSYPGISTSMDLDSAAHVGVIALAAILRWGINHGLVLAAIALSNPTAPVRDLYASVNFSEQVLEAGALGLGLVTATIVVTSPFVLPGIVVTVVALHRGVLVHQYERASRTDTKTGLTAAGPWHDFADRALARARDHGTTMGLLIIDLDHFKAINDTYGHPYGDDVLKEVAKELISEVRDQDACGRWGGEEFAIAVPDVGNTHNLEQVAERIRRRIQSIVMQPPGTGVAGSVSPTASIGAAIFPADGITTIDELLLAADTALYEAKNSGRNNVRLSASVPLTVPKNLLQAEPTD